MAQDLYVLPDEVLKVYSQDAILEAQPNYTFRRFVEHKMDLSARPGKKIEFPRLGLLTQGKMLASEYEQIPTASRKYSWTELEVFEFGNSIETTSFLDKVSFRNELKDSAMLFGLDYQAVMDAYLRDKYLSTANVQFGGGAASTATIASTGIFSTKEIKDAILTLKLLKAPPITRGNDSFYVCIGYPKQFRNLRDDAAWLAPKNYVDPQNIYFGEIGRYENVVFIETTQMPVEIGAGAGGINIYNAVIFGSRAVGFAEGLPFELRSDPPKDLGRAMRIGWYSIFGAAILNDFIVRVKTA